MSNETRPREGEALKQTAQGAPGALVIVDERYTYKIFSCLNPAAKLVDMKHQVVNGTYHEVRLFTKPGDTAAQWKFTERTSDGYYLILNQWAGNLALGEAKNDDVLVSALTRSPAQYWILKEVGNGYYYFENKYDGLVMDVKGSGTADGTGIVVWRRPPSGATANQQFKIVQV